MQRLIPWLGVAAGVLAAAGIVALLAAVLWTPAQHDVHTPGATAITNFQIAKADRPTYGIYGLTPSQSLANLRCEAWQAIRRGACPGAAALAQEFWPGVTQSPNTLYVVLQPSCLGYGAGFNVEYLKSNRMLVFHCYTSAAQITFPATHLPGVQAVPMAELVVVRTDGIGPGEVLVIEDDRVEHPLGDDSSQTPLGTVTILTLQ